jgi:hypothetical protein
LVAHGIDVGASPGYRSLSNAPAGASGVFGRVMRSLAFGVMAVLVASALGGCDRGHRGVDHDTTTIIHDDRTVVVPAPAPPARDPRDHGFPPPDRHDHPPPPDRRDADHH